MTSLTDQEINQLLTAIDYTLATISSNPVKSTEKPGWVHIHGGRAYQSLAYLDQAKTILNEIKKSKDSNETNV